MPLTQAEIERAEIFCGRKLTPYEIQQGSYSGFKDSRQLGPDKKECLHCGQFIMSERGMTRHLRAKHDGGERDKMMRRRRKDGGSARPHTPSPIA